MLKNQIAMPFPARGSRSYAPIIRRRRRPFVRPEQTGPYHLPDAVSDRLGSLLSGFRNGEAAYALAVFLARFWSTPSRLDTPFPIDRRALADHRDLQLSEAQVRGAIQTLERIGFLERALIGKGSKFQLKGSELHRKPISFQFGDEFREAFSRANKRSKIANPTRRALPARFPVFSANSPKKKSEAERTVLMGEVTKRVFDKEVAPATPNSRLEAAIARLGHAVREKVG